MDKLTRKDKHKILLKNKRYIIERYNKNIPIKKIARIYRVSTGCISNNLKLWGIRRKHGVKYLLGKILLKGD